MFGVVEPDSAMAFVPQSRPRLGSRLASLTNEFVHAHDAGNKQVGELIASTLVEPVALGKSCYPSGSGGDGDAASHPAAGSGSEN